MTKKTAAEFVKAAHSAIGSKYWYACSGQKPTRELLDASIRDWPGKWTAARIAKARSEIGKGNHVFDCIGLVRWCSGMDKNRDALYTNADKLRTMSNPKPISTLPEVPGVCVFMKGHIGIYIGGGRVIEAYNFKHVASNALSFQAWTHWGYIPWVDYGTAPKPAATTPPDSYTVKKGDSWWKIAAEQLGNGTEMNRLAAHNGMTTADMIHPGQKLKIPKK